jgi:hypothetical protein
MSVTTTAKTALGAFRAAVERKDFDANGGLESETVAP